MKGKGVLTFCLVLIVVSSAFASIKCETVAADGEPGISVVGVVSLGNDTDIWSVNLNKGTDVENFKIYGTQSDPVISDLSSQVLATASNQETGNTIIQQDILLGFTYSWNYTLEIPYRSKIDVIACNLGVRFPVRVQLQCPENMARGSVYPLNATLTPLDWPNFDEFVCSFKVLGQSIINESQSLTTPLGPENAWTPFEIGPIIIWPKIPFVLCNLDLGFVIVPELFSQKIEAEINVAGDSTLIGSDKIVWTSPGQTAQFDVKADNSTGLNYSSIVLSNFHFFLDSLLVDFKAYLQANWWWDGSSSARFTLFTVDASKLLPSLSFGAISPYTRVQTIVPVTGEMPRAPTYYLTVIPEIGNGDVLVNGTAALAHVGGNHVGGRIAFTLGDVANLTAVPASGWTFDNWLGLGTSNPLYLPLYLTMTENKSAWAVFTENSTRTLRMLPSIGGTTLPQAGVSGYVNMSQVTLYAYPSANYQFYRWAINYQSSPSVN